MDLTAIPLNREAFHPFGDVIEKGLGESYLINNDKCRRHHALSKVDHVGDDSHVLINIFSGEPYDLPLELKMVERHPFGSQAFYPLGPQPYLVIVSHDENGVPGPPSCFLAHHNQGINLKRNVWHGVLTPLFEPADFLVVDRGGSGNNLEEHFFTKPYRVSVPNEILAASAFS